MARFGQAYLQTLQGLSSKEEVLEVHGGKHGLSREEAETICCHYLEFIVVKATATTAYVQPMEKPSLEKGIRSSRARMSKE